MILTIHSIEHMDLTVKNWKELKERSLKNKLIFAFFESFPQATLQILNNLFVGQTLTWIQLIVPLTSYYTGVRAYFNSRDVNDYLVPNITKAGITHFRCLPLLNVFFLALAFFVAWICFFSQFNRF